MMNKQEKKQLKLEKKGDVLYKVAIPILIVAALLTLFFLYSTTAKVGDKAAETAAYTRVSNCIAARLATDRITQMEIEKCYVQVEKNTNISLERFDEQQAAENEQ